jgi:MSHA biogenesis protein MshN
MLRDIESKKKTELNSTPVAQAQQWKTWMRQVHLYFRFFLLALIVVNIVIAAGVWFLKKPSIKTPVIIASKKSSPLSHHPKKQVSVYKAIGASNKPIQPIVKKMKATKKTRILPPKKQLSSVSLNPNNVTKVIQNKPIKSSMRPLILEKEPQIVKPKLVKKLVPLTMREKSIQQYQKALALFDQDDRKKAQRILSGIIKRDKLFSAARESLALSFEEIGQVDKAMKLLNESMQLIPTSISLLQLKASLLLKTLKYKEAFTLLNAHQPDFNSMPEYYALKAVAYEKIGKYKKAGELYHALVKQAPYNARYWLGLGVALERTKQLNQAVSAYTKVLENYQAAPVISAYAKERIAELRG